MIRPKVVLLDLDNTIYAYAPCHAAGLAALVEITGDPAIVDAYDRGRKAVKHQVGNVAAAHCRLLYIKALIEESGKGDLALAVRLHNAYWDGYFAAMVLEDGVRELLDAFRRDGVKTAWVSDFTTERQILKLNALGIADAVDILITSEEAGAEKPDPRGVDLALKRLGAEGQPGWFVGDDVERDLAPGRARGLETVWYSRPGKKPGTPPDAIVQDWLELGELYAQSN